MCCYGKRKSHVHAAAISLYRRIDKFVDAREINNRIKLLSYFVTRHSQNGAIEEDVFTARKFLVKSCANLQQAADTTVQVDCAFAHFGNSRQDFQQRALTGSVSTDDTDDFSGFNLEAHIF